MGVNPLKNYQCSVMSQPHNTKIPSLAVEEQQLFQDNFELLMFQHLILMFLKSYAKLT